MLRAVNMSTKKMAQKEEYKNVKYKMILNNSHYQKLPTRPPKKPPHHQKMTLKTEEEQSTGLETEHADTEEDGLDAAKKERHGAQGLTLLEEI